MTSQVRTLPYREGGLAANLGRLPGFGPELLAMKTSQTGEPAVICTPVMLAAARSWPGSHTDIPEAGRLGRVPALELQITSMPITMTAILIRSRKAAPAGGAPN
jgi:hypothetical protein